MKRIAVPLALLIVAMQHGLVGAPSGFGQGPLLASPCPDTDLDGYADCRVAGCDTSGLLCGDCDDTRTDVNPGRAELCNHRDDDCKGGVDEGTTKLWWSARAYDPNQDPERAVGKALATAGDLTGDGIPDLVVGGNGQRTPYGSTAGAVAIFSGIDRQYVCRMIDSTGPTEGGLGYSVSSAGDVNGDGVNDIAAGAPYDRGPAGSKQGAAFLFSGRDCSLLIKMRDPDGRSNDYLGWSIAGVGDVSGDGTPDIAAGAYLRTVAGYAGAGEVILFSGADGSVIRRLDDPAPSSSANLGKSLAAIGDVTGDAVSDLAVGAPGSYPANPFAGSVVLFSGATGAFIRRLTDPTASSSKPLGEAVSGIADLTGDGKPDVLAGSPRDSVSVTSAGSVLLFNGATGAFVRRMRDSAGAVSDNLGSSVAAIGDLDGDGSAEVLAGVPYDNTAVGDDSGSLVIFSGASGTVFARLSDPAGTRGDLLGTSVAALGDVNGDGVVEIYSGATQANSVEVDNCGVVTVFSLQSDCDGDGVSPAAGDCNDQDNERSAGNAESCDGVDNDCDAELDETVDIDAAGACEDCDESDALVFPGAPERCNAIDDDCDGSVNEGVDADGDLHSTPCDCDDAVSTVFPGSPETCDHRDQDCDREVDEGWTGLTAQWKILAPRARSDDRFATAVAASSDLTGDGIPDVVLGGAAVDTIHGTDSGIAWVVSGTDRSTWCQLLDPEGAASARLGSSVASVDDLDGDGTPEIAVGAPYDDIDGTMDAGSVLVFSGATCQAVAKLIDPTPAAGRRLGTAVAAAADVTGDGKREIAVGAAGNGGQVLIFASGTYALIRRLVDPAVGTGDQLGSCLVPMGDVNGDGVEDLAACAPYDNTSLGRGSISMFSGATGVPLFKILNPPNSASGTADGLGESACGIDDVDGDGVREVAAGMPYRAAVALYSGRTGAFIKFLTAPTAGGLGKSVARLADRTGDGIAEILAGAPTADVAGRLGVGEILVLDPVSGNEVNRHYDAEGLEYDNFGSLVAVLPDTNGDTLDEIVATSPGDDTPAGLGAGSVSFLAQESDCDGDGVTPFGGDCDDASVEIYGRPGEVTAVRFEGDRETLRWTAPAALGGDPLTVGYDVVRSGSAGNFHSPVCVEQGDGSDTAALDSARPAPGTGFFYLVRAVNRCSQGTPGTDSEQLARRVGACPPSFGKTVPAADPRTGS